MFRRILAVSSLIAFGLLLALGATEAALRVYDLLKPQPPVARGQFWQPKLGFGWLHFPDMQAPYFDDRGEYSVDVAINSHGLRDVEHEYAKSPGVFRILILGDSYMEAVQVTLEESFPRLLEGALRRDGRRIEIINASAAEWGTDNQLVYLKEEGIKYSPDLVLLAFTTANDVRNNSRVLNMRIPNPNGYKPSFSLSPDGSLQFHPMPSLPPAFPSPPWWQNIRVATFFMNRAGHLLESGAPPPLPAPTPSRNPPATAPPASLPPPTSAPSVPAPTASKVPTDMLVYASPPPREVAEAWLVTKALILEIQREAQQRGAGFAMFFVNGPWAHYNDYWDLMMMNDDAAKLWNRKTPNETLALFATEKSIPFVDLFAEFEAKKKSDRLFFRFDPHWTPAGHRLAADVVAKFLVNSQVVPQSRSTVSR